MTLSFGSARECVEREVRARSVVPETESVPLVAAGGRVLASDVFADRDYPALDRSVRDGFAVRSVSLPGTLRVSGEVRAGEAPKDEVLPGEAIEIMTGAAVPPGADAVIMVEHVVRSNGLITHTKAADPGQFISRRGEEARSGDLLICSGKRVDYTDVAVLASAGYATVPVFRRPSVAILATGDELVDVGVSPEPHQIRNSNACSLASQVSRAGGVALVLPVARDDEAHTRALIERGLKSDLLLLSGGVSAGKYDFVERVLAGLGAEFFFDRVKIQPGQPVVFGRALNRFFFGLPGNPCSTMVTFETLGRAALELLAGQTDPTLPFALGRLTERYSQKSGLTRFLPARLSGQGDLARIPWRGSSDIPAISRANCFLVADADREQWNAGEVIPVLLK